MEGKLYQHRPQIAKTNFCVIKHPTSTPPKLVVTLPPNHSTLRRHLGLAVTPPNHSTLQCHHVHSPQSWSSPSQPSHTTTAPCEGTQQWHHVHSTKVGRHPPPTMADYNGTLRRHPAIELHPAMAPCNGTQQWHVHSTIAHYNGTLHRHPAMAPLPLNHSTLQWHPAMAPCPLNHSTHTHYNGTLRWHPAIAPRPLHPAMAFWCRPMRKSGSSPSPPIGSKNPYSYRYLGENTLWLMAIADRPQALNLVCVCRSFMTKGLILGSKRFPRYLKTFIPIMSKTRDSHGKDDTFIHTFYSKRLWFATCEERRSRLSRVQPPLKFPSSFTTKKLKWFRKMPEISWDLQDVGSLWVWQAALISCPNASISIQHVSTRCNYDSKHITLSHAET